MSMSPAEARFHDTLHFLNCLQPGRIANVSKVLASYYLSRWKKKPIQWGLPFNISIEPTTACNLRCPECPSGLRAFSRPTGMLKEEFFEKTLEELAPHLVYLYFYFQGEPYLNPKFLDFVQLAAKKNIYTVTSTNAHFLHEKNAQKTIESGLSRLIISIDGTTQETYSSYRREGELSKVLEGAKNMVYWREKMGAKKPYLIFQFLVVKPNEHQIAEVKKIATDIGIDEVKLKTAQVYDYENGNPLIPTIDQYARYKKGADGKWSIKNKLLNHCWKLWHSCVITWDGQLVPCCFDKDATHRLGDLKNQTFQDIWQGPAYQAFRANILKSRKEIDICTNCTEGTKVWA